MKLLTFIILSLLAATPAARALELSLDQCRQMALQASEQMQIARNRVEQSKMDRAVARAAYFPKIDGSATALYLSPNSKVGDAMELQMKGLYLAGFTLTQPIFAGGKIIAANKLASVGKEVAQQQLRLTEMDILAEAEKTYWSLVAVDAKIDMINAYITQLDSIMSYTRSAYELGFTTELSLSRIDTRLADLQYKLRQAQTGRDLCRMALCNIIGLDTSTPITATETLDDETPAGTTFPGIEARPELQLANLNITAKKHDVGLVMADYLPTIGLQLGWNAFGNLKMNSYTPLPDGSIYTYTQNMNYRHFIGALSISVPIFHWGEGYNKVKKAKMEVRNATLELQHNRKLMELQARQALDNYIDGFTLVSSALTSLNEAQRNLDTMQEQYRAGLMTLTDMLEAQSQWQASCSNVIEARTQQKINHVEYLRATGLLR